MNQDEIKNILDFFFKHINNQDLKWRIGGSMNLNVQGMNLIPNDIDIVTDHANFHKFEKLFDKYIHSRSIKKDLKLKSFTCKIDEQELEIGTFDNEDFNLKNITNTSWNKYIIPILPLKHVCDYYIKTNRPKKAELVNTYLESLSKYKNSTGHTGHTGQVRVSYLN